MNPNRPVDEFGREEITITSVVEVKSATGETVSTNLLLDGNPVAEANPLPVAVTNELTVGFASPPAVEVNNFPADPASGTNQVTANGKLDTVITHTSNTATNTNSINGKLPSLTTSPTTLTSAIPVRQAPSLVPGKHLHVQTSAGIANAANKMLLGFNNDTGLACYVTRIHCANLQTSPISGVFTWLYVRRATGLISGGTQLTTLTSPAIVPSMRDPSFSVPVGFTFWTNATQAGTITTLESARWTTDEVSPNGSGLAEMILAQGNYHDLWDFQDDPIVIPDQYSLAVVCDSTATNGQTLVDFNIQFGV